ncbi:MAG: sensor histidine kinase [bacterium]
MSLPPFPSAFHAWLQRIIPLTLHGLTLVDCLQDILKSLVDFTGCDEIEIHVQKGDVCYHGTIRTDSSSPRVERIGLKPGMNGLSGIFTEGLSLEHSLPFLSININPSYPARIAPGGSLWSGNARTVPSQAKGSARFPRQPAAAGRNTMANPASASTFPSWAVIPLHTPTGKIGLLLLKSSRGNFFDEERIELYESVAPILVLAIMSQSSQADLNERVKELTCLYNLMQWAARPGVTMEEICQGLIAFLPSAWQYPEITAARLVLDGKTYASANYRPCAFHQTAEIVIQGKRRGELEVTYLDVRPDLDEGPFLKEERNLLNALARQISLILQRQQADEEKTLLSEQLRHADRLATIGQLAAGVAHELNEPLGAILGFAQLALKQPGLPGPTAQDLHKIVKMSLHAREIIKKLMLFARQTPPRKTSVNLNAVVEEALSLLQARLSQNNIALVRRFSPMLPELTVDPSQMQQVLVNLIVNAVQAMPQGGTITLATQVEGNHLSLVVEDTGTGMDEEIQKQLFVPFFTTKNFQEGTGLGLPVVHGIVAAHGGTIQVQSAPGQGARFEIRLPVSKVD